MHHGFSLTSWHWHTIAPQSALSSLNLTRRSEYTRSHTHGEERLVILEIVVL